MDGELSEGFRLGLVARLLAHMRTICQFFSFGIQSKCPLTVGGKIKKPETCGLYIEWWGCVIICT